MTQDTRNDKTPRLRRSAHVTTGQEASGRSEDEATADQPPGTMTVVPLISHDWNVYESHTQSSLLVPQVVPWQLWPRKIALQSVLRASQSSWCCSAEQTGAPSHAAIARHWPVKQPSLTSAT